jgi:hypothetical protein
MFDDDEDKNFAKLGFERLDLRDVMLREGHIGVSVELQLTTTVGLLVDKPKDGQAVKLDLEAIKRVASMVVMRIFGVGVTAEQAKGVVTVPHETDCPPAFAARLVNHSDIGLSIRDVIQEDDLKDQDPDAFAKSRIVIRVTAPDMAEAVEAVSAEEKPSAESESDEAAQRELEEAKREIIEEFLTAMQGAMSYLQQQQQEGLAVSDNDSSKEEKQAWKEWVKKQVKN